MIRPCCALFALILLAAAPVSAEVPLRMALAKAYLENPELEAARARLRAVDENVSQALSRYRPRLESESSFRVDDISTNREDVTLQTSRTALNLEQELYSGGSRGARLNAAEKEVLAQRARLELVEQDVLLKAVAAFTRVITAQRILEKALANERRLLRPLEAVRDRFRFGEVTRTDVAPAESRYAAAMAARREAEGDLRSAGAAFRRVIGDPPGTLIMPGLPEALPDDEAAALELVDETPLVRAAGFAAAAARHEIDEALAALKPRFSLNGEASYVDEPGASLDFQSNLALGATLTIPLYQGGREYSRVRQTRQTASERRHLLANARRAAAEEIVVSLEARDTARENLRALERSLRAAEIALEGVREEAQIGVRSVLDILDAEQELFEAEVALVEAERDEIVAAYRLKAAVGRLNAVELGLDASIYDPKAYYAEVRNAWFGTGGDGDDAEAVREWDG